MDYILVYVFGGIGLVFLFAALFIRIAVQNKKDNCISKTTGRVIKYGLRISEDAPIYIPVVEYEANGNKYRKNGPRYECRTVVLSSPFIKETTCEYTTYRESQVFKFKLKRNSVMSAVRNPMEVLFPLNSEVDVYYDPRNPKRAYILRQLECRSVIMVFSIIGAVFTAVSGVLFFVFR